MPYVLKKRMFMFKRILLRERQNERQSKILKRHNRLEAITLIGIVLGWRCPGVLCPGGQLSLEEIVRVQLSGGNFP